MPDIEDRRDEEPPPEMTPVEQICEALVDAADSLALGQELRELARGILSIGDGLRAISAALARPEQRYYARMRSDDPRLLVPLVVGIGYGVTVESSMFGGRTWDLVKAASTDEAVFAEVIRTFEGLTASEDEL